MADTKSKNSFPLEKEMLENIDFLLNYDFLEDEENWDNLDALGDVAGEEGDDD